MAILFLPLALGAVLPSAQAAKVAVFAGNYGPERSVFSEWANKYGLATEVYAFWDQAQMEQVLENLDQYEALIVGTNVVRDGLYQIFMDHRDDIRQWVEGGGRLVVLGQFNGETTGGQDAYEWLEVFGIGRGPQNWGNDIGWLKAGDPVFQGVTEQELEATTWTDGNNYWSTLEILDGHPDAGKWEVLAKNDVGDVLMARGKFGKGMVLVTSWQIGNAEEANGHWEGGEWVWDPAPGPFARLFSNSLDYVYTHGGRKPVPAPGLLDALVAGALMLSLLGVMSRPRVAKGSMKA